MRSKLIISLFILPMGLITLSGVAQAKTTPVKNTSYSWGVHQGGIGNSVAYTSKLSKLTPEQQQQLQQLMNKLKQDQQKLVQDKKDYKKSPSGALKQAIVADQATIKQDKSQLQTLRKQFGLISSNQSAGGSGKKLTQLTPEQQQQLQQVMDKIKQDKIKLSQDKKDYKKSPSDQLKQTITTDQATLKQDKVALQDLRQQFGLI